MKTILNVMVTVFAAAILLSCVKHKTVSICHIPPGNPSNKTTIQVSVNALAAHQAHGDYLGTCTETVNPCDACYASYKECLESAGGKKGEIAKCEANYKTCIEMVGPCEKKDPCKECDLQHQDCIASAGGDADLLLQCEQNYKKCRSTCDAGTPPAPADPGAGK